MDNLTHSLIGLAMSRAGLNRVAPHATAIAILAANAADIDILALAGGQASYLHYHRNITHALVMIPAMALLGLLVARLFARKGEFPWRRGYLIALAAAATHPFLDWTNTYGVRMFLPFSADWLRLDITNVFDVWIWAVLIFAALGTALSKLVSSEIGGKSGSGRGLAVFALCFVALFYYGRYILHTRAVATLESRIYDGASPTRVAAFPGPVNPLEWRGLVDTGDAYTLVPVNLLQELDLNDARKLYKAAPQGADEAARNAAERTAPFRIFLDFSQYPLWRFSPNARPEGTRVEAMDLRFGAPPTPRFVATAVVGPDFQVLHSWFGY